MTIINIETNKITVPNAYPDYVLDDNYLDGIIRSMRIITQISPILVTSDYKLVDGFYRLSAAIKLNYNSIKAVIVPDGLSSEEITRLESQYNKNELSILEFSDLLLSGFMAHIDQEGYEPDQFNQQLSDFANEAAKELNLSEDKIIELLTISISINPKAKSVITNLKLDCNQNVIDEISKLSAKDQTDNLIIYDDEYIINNCIIQNEAC